MNYPLVAKLAASHQLVGVGESTHGTHEFFDFKSQLFKKLTEHGFNVLLLEDSPGVCSQINDYIKSARGNIDQLMTGLYSVWRTKELKQLIVWLKDNYKQCPVELVGFDIFQSADNLKVRDELMAKNIFNYVKANPKSKVFIWAHNVHVKSVSHKDGEPMGKFLRKWFGRDYFAIGQFFGVGSFSATIIDEKNPDWLNRKLSVVSVNSIPSDFLEHRLNEIDEKPYYLSNIGMAAFKYLDKTYRARSLGWGLVPNQVDSIVERLNPVKDFDIITYFPSAMHSQPLKQYIIHNSLEFLSQ